MADENDPQINFPPIIDISSIYPNLRDLSPGKTQSLKQEQDNYSEVQSEIETNQPTAGARACIPDKDVDELKTCTKIIEDLKRHFQLVSKVHEVIEESRIFYEDKRESIIRSIASSVDARAKLEKSDDLLALYQKTREYRSAIGKKAAKTRKKNLKAEEEKSEEEKA